MLVESDRLTDADRLAWEMLERSDHTTAFRRRESLALRTIERFIEEGPAYASVSWGKDSVVIAHLTRRVDPTVPVVRVRLPVVDNPDCLSVCDEYLAGWPMAYHEVWNDKPDVKDGWLQTGQHKIGHEVANREYGRRITGIRAAESGTRTMSARVHGRSTKNVCRPILYWPTSDVFAYLRYYDLPVHPAYAMNNGGRMDRHWLRVASIGGKRGSDRGRREWERMYYGDVLDRMLLLER